VAAHARDLGRVREQAKQAEGAYQVARQAADRAADRERDARHQQQQYQAHQEANPDLVDRRRELLRVQAWRSVPTLKRPLTSWRGCGRAAAGGHCHNPQQQQIHDLLEEVVVHELPGQQQPQVQRADQRL
jgi:hypothetical protein